MAIEQTVANPNSKAAANAVAAAKGANAPPAELTAAVSKVATNLGGVYFLSSLGNPALDPFRYHRHHFLLLLSIRTSMLMTFIANSSY